MPKEIVLDVTTGIVVLGTFFGASNWEKITTMLRKIQARIHQTPKPTERAG